MGMPTEPLLDIMRRSMANLAFIERRAGPKGPYEVTQLVNTFLGALAHPFEAMRHDLMELPLAEAANLGWPAVARERPGDAEPSSLGDLIRSLRNAIAHGNVEFLADGNGKVGAIRLWNSHPRTHVLVWSAIVTVHDMRQFLSGFVDLIEERHQQFGYYERGAA